MTATTNLTPTEQMFQMRRDLDQRARDGWDRHVDTMLAVVAPPPDEDDGPLLDEGSYR